MPGQLLRTHGRTFGGLFPATGRTKQLNKEKQPRFLGSEGRQHDDQSHAEELDARARRDDLGDAGANASRKPVVQSRGGRGHIDYVQRRADVKLDVRELHARPWQNQRYQCMCARGARRRTTRMRPSNDGGQCT